MEKELEVWSEQTVKVINETSNLIDSIVDVLEMVIETGEPHQGALDLAVRSIRVWQRKYDGLPEDDED